MRTLNCFEIWARRRRVLLKLLIQAFIPFLVLSNFLGYVGGARVPGMERECKAIANHFRGKEFTYPWWSTLGGDAERDNEKYGNSTVAIGCPSGRSGERGTKCCREFDASVLKREMGAKFNEKWLGTKLTTNGDIFKERKNKFDVTFKDLLTRAHAAFHAMFERTYGMLYIQHAPIFHELFKTLELYYDTGRESLEGKLNGFFSLLTRKMFVVLNAQYEFDDTYLSCATIVINEKQGGDLHRQIVSSLRRSFVATRTLAQGLNDADKIFTNLRKLKMSPECISSVTLMLHCPICSDIRALKPCLPFCRRVTTQCLIGTTPIIKAWHEFTNAMENILDRLLGPYNVEAVVEPIHIKISEAIMNFQESGPDLSQAVFQKCGKPKLKSKSLSKRDVFSQPPEQLKRRPDEISKSGSRTTDRTDSQPSKSLEKLLREIKSKVKKSKTVWDVLPRQVCNVISKDYSSQLCWNGNNAIKPDRNSTVDDPEIRSTSTEKGPPSVLITEQIIILQQITERLRASYNGLDVQWTQSNDDLDIDGSGMGSGSGDLIDQEEDGDQSPDGLIPPQRKARPPPSPPLNNKHPKGQSRHPPPILTDTEDADEEDEDESEELFDPSDVKTWRPFNSFNRTSENSHTRGEGNNNGFTIDNSDIEFVPFPPKSNRPGIFISSTIPTTTQRTTTTRATTRRPTGPEVTKKKHPVSASGSMDEAGKAVAFFKLFSPILASMVGKAFSFT